MESLRRGAIPAGMVHRCTITRKLTYDENLSEEIAAALWQDPPDQLVAESKPLQVKNRTVAVRYEHPAGVFVFKRHIWGGVSRTLRKMYRECTARRCGKLGKFLAQQQIPTPSPRAYLEHCAGPFTYRSYLLTDYIEGLSLFDFIRSRVLSGAELQSFADQIAAIWKRLVELNISHNDLKPENFIVDRSGKVWLIDLERIRIHRSAAQLRRRHLEDARIFLHIRNWRDQLEAAELFRQKIAATLLETNVVSDPAPEHCLFRTGYSEHELANRVSVAIVTDSVARDEQAIMRTRQSVRDLADEVVLVRPSSPPNEFRVVGGASSQPSGPVARTSKLSPMANNFSPNNS